jgi:hypothetical protein
MVVVDLVALQPVHKDLESIDKLIRPPLYEDGSFQHLAKKNDWSKRNDFEVSKNLLYDGRGKFWGKPSGYYKSHLEEFGGVRRKEEWLRGFEDAGWTVSDMRDIGTMFELVKGAGKKAGINEGWDSLDRRMSSREGYFPSNFASFLERTGKFFYMVKFYLVKLCNRIFKQNETPTSRETSLGNTSAQIKEMMIGGKEGGEGGGVKGDGSSSRPEALWHGYIEAIKFAPTYTQKLLEIWYDKNQVEQKLIVGAIGNEDIALMGFVLRA